MEKNIIKKTLIASSIALVLGTPVTQAALVQDVLGPNTWETDSGNFTMLDSNGNTMGSPGGTNDVNMFWDGDAYNASSDYTGPGSTSNITASSTTPFFGHIWTAHDIQMFTPGSYSFDTTLGGGSSESGTLNITVPTGNLGMHMLWDWNGTLNIDVFMVLAPNSIFGSGKAMSDNFSDPGFFSSGCDAPPNDDGRSLNCLNDSLGFGTDGKPAGDTIWMLTSVDGDGDGVMGIPMAPGGPLAGYNWNFNANLQPVPIPAAAWLFGSGLLGLIGVTRRKRTE